MARVLDMLNERIWFAIERQTERVDLMQRSEWDTEWERMWTSEWNYDNIYMIFHPRHQIWVWTDGNKGNSLV